MRRKNVREKVRKDNGIINIGLDNIRPTPKGFVWCKSVNQAILVIHQKSKDHTMNPFGKINMEGIRRRYWTQY